MWEVKSHSFNNRINSSWEVDLESIEDAKPLPTKLHCHKVIIADEESKTPFSGTIKQSYAQNYMGKFTFEGSGIINIYGKQKTWICKHLKRTDKNGDVISFVRVSIGLTELNLSTDSFSFTAEKEIDINLWNEDDVPVKLIMKALEKLAEELDEGL